MTKKQKEDKVKEMEQFIEHGVPEEARDKEYEWEQEPPICTYAIEPKQKMNENMKKFLEMISKDETLKQKVLACKDLEKDDVVRSVIALAKEMGIELTEADIIVEKDLAGIDIIIYGTLK